MWFILVVIIAIITFQIVSKQKYKKLETEVLKKLGFSNWNIVSYLDEQVIVKSRQTLEKYDAVKFFKENKEKLESSMYHLIENLRKIAILLKPFINDTAENIFKQIGITSKDDKQWESLKTNINNKNQKVIEKGEPIFMRLNAEEEIGYIKSLMKR